MRILSSLFVVSPITCCYTPQKTAHPQAPSLLKSLRFQLESSSSTAGDEEIDQNNNYSLHELSAFIQGCWAEDGTSVGGLTNVSYGELADWFAYSLAVDSEGLDLLLEKVQHDGISVLEYYRSYKFEGESGFSWYGGVRNLPPPSRRHQMLHVCLSLQDLVSMAENRPNNR